MLGVREENIAARRTRKTRNLGDSESLEKAVGLRLNAEAQDYPKLKERSNEEGVYVWRRRERLSVGCGAHGTRAELQSELRTGYESEPELEPERLGLEPERLGLEPERLGLEPGRPGLEPGRPGLESERRA